MADVKKIIEILITGKNEFSPAAEEALVDVGKFSEGFGTVTEKLASVNDALFKVQGALGAVATGGFLFAATKAAEYNKALTLLQKVLSDDEAANIKKIEDSVRSLANTYAKSRVEILNSVTTWKQAGYETQEALTLAEESLRLAIAGDIEAAEATEILISSLKGFEAPASEAARLIDILNETSNKYAADVKQLGAGFAEISPIAKQMGFSFEETAGLITPVIEVFRSGAEAGTALKTGLLRLVSDTKPVQDALESIGVAQKDANGNLRSGRDILFDVGKAFQNLSNEQKAYITQELVGIEQSARMIKVFDNLNYSLKVTADAQKSAGSAAEEIAKVMKTTVQAAKQFKNSFKDTFIDIGKQLDPFVAKVIKSGSSIFAGIQQAIASGALDEVFDLLKEWLEELSDFLKAIAKNIPETLEGVDFSGFVASAREMADEVKALFKAAFGEDITTTEGLQNALQGAVDWFEKLQKAVKGSIEIFVRVVGFIEPVIEKIGDINPEIFELIGNLAGLGKTVDLAGGAFGAFGDVAGGLGSILGGLLSTLGGVAMGLGGVGNAIGGVGNAIGGASNLVVFFGESLTSMGGGALAAARGLKSVVTVAKLMKFASAIAAAAAIGYALGTLLNKLQFVRDGAQAAIGAIDRVFNLGIGGPTEKELDKINEKFEEAKRIAAERAEAMKNGEAGAQEAIQKTREEVDSLTEALTNVPTETRAKLEVEIEKEKIRARAREIEKELQLKATIDTKRLEEQGKLLREKVRAQADIAKKELELEFQLDIQKLNNDLALAQTVVNREFDLDERQIELEFDLKIARLEQQSQYAKDLLNFSAEIETAKIEADSKKIEAMFDSLAEQSKSAGEVINNSFDLLSGLDFESWDWGEQAKITLILEQIKKENDRQDKRLEAELKLMEAERKLAETKQTRLDSGKGIELILSAKDEIEPHLENIWMHVIEKIQPIVSDELGEALFGILGETV